MITRKPMRAMSECATSHDKDLLGSRWAMWLLWIAPWILIIGSSHTANTTHTVVWASSFTVGGAACIVNARRCGRVHCFYTGPLYLLAALASLLYGLHVLPLGQHGWDWIIDTTAALSLLACCGLERLLGKYTETRSTSPDIRRA
jgi:hypothetical protein